MATMSSSRWSCQLEELIVAAVLYRLDTPQLADILAGRNAQDEQTAALSDTLAQDEAQLTELAEMYANREIGRSDKVRHFGANYAASLANGVKADVRRVKETAERVAA